LDASSTLPDEIQAGFCFLWRQNMFLGTKDSNFNEERSMRINKLSWRFMGIAFVFLAFVAIPPAVAEDKVYSFSESDPEMNAAIRKARDSLPIFWSKFAAPSSHEKDFTLKIKIDDENGTEHFWCGMIEGNSTSATCVIDNDPQTVKSVSIGQRIAADPASISDWMYMRDGKIVGGETIRVILPRLSKDEAEEFRSLLAEP
jgi:uncharacterized protein YegJ (DUF2314 family)